MTFQGLTEICAWKLRVQTALAQKAKRRRGEGLVDGFVLTGDKNQQAALYERPDVSGKKDAVDVRKIDVQKDQLIDLARQNTVSQGRSGQEGVDLAGRAFQQGGDPRLQKTDDRGFIVTDSNMYHRVISFEGIFIISMTLKTPLPLSNSMLPSQRSTI